MLLTVALITDEVRLKATKADIFVCRTRLILRITAVSMPFYAFSLVLIDTCNFSGLLCKLAAGPRRYNLYST